MPQTVVPDDTDASSTPSSSPSQGGEPPGAAPDTPLAPPTPTPWLHLPRPDHPPPHPPTHLASGAMPQAARTPGTVHRQLPSSAGLPATAHRELATGNCPLFTKKHKKPPVLPGGFVAGLWGRPVPQGGKT